MMKIFSSHFPSKKLSILWVKIAVCFLLSGLAYRFFSSTFFQLSPPELVYCHLSAPSESCNLFLGEWVPDFSGPAYTNATCRTIEPPQNCLKNGRPDSDYAEEAVEVYHDEAYKNRKWTFPSHNFTVSVVWAPFLTKASTFEDDNGISSGPTHLFLDEPNPIWANQYNKFHYIVIGAGKWFLKSAIYHDQNTVVGCHNCHHKNTPELVFYYEYRKALNTTLQFMGQSRHRVGEVEVNGVDGRMRALEIDEFDGASGKLWGLELLDTTLMSVLRPDGHPGIYRRFHPYEEKKGNKGGRIQNDCLHWCLPGPIDAWNDLIMAMLVFGV
ncbi:trichome birefringence-like, partial [Striga asiatica]